MIREGKRERRGQVFKWSSHDEKNRLVLNDLSDFCWIQRMSRERIKGRQATESEAKVEMRL